MNERHLLTHQLENQNRKHGKVGMKIVVVLDHWGRQADLQQEYLPERRLH